MKRNKQRLDYKKLASTGEKVIKVDDQIDNLENLLSNWSLSDMAEEKPIPQEASTLLVDEQLIAGEIEDFIDLYDVKDACGCITDMNEALAKI